jgi:hypothetical protein
MPPTFFDAQPFPEGYEDFLDFIVLDARRLTFRCPSLCRVVWMRASLAPEHAAALSRDGGRP